MKRSRRPIQDQLFGHDGRTVVVNVDLEAHDIYCGRPRGGADPKTIDPFEYGGLGNPFSIRTFPDALDRYREYFSDRIAKDGTFRRRVRSLRGKRLGCYCVDRYRRGACHVRIIIEWIEANP